MDQLKTYLQDRLKFLQQVADADPSEDCISTLGQMHEINHILQWIDEHDNASAPQSGAHDTTPKA